MHTAHGCVSKTVSMTKTTTINACICFGLLLAEGSIEKHANMVETMVAFCSSARPMI